MKEKKQHILLEKQRMRQLIFLLEEWRHARYQLQQDKVSLEIYDQHFTELLVLEKKCNFFFPDSPTQSIGFLTKKEGISLLRREIPMLSLDSINSDSELENWEKRLKKCLKTNFLDYVVEWKIDGLSLSLIYCEGKLIRLSTRGDGFFGEDLTFNKHLLKNIPLELKKKENIEVRGEVFISKEDFFFLNEELKKQKKGLFSNPRNTVSGIIRSLLPDFRGNLFFFAYSLLGKQDIFTQIECLQKLKEMGFSSSPFWLCQDLSEVKKKLSEMLAERKNIDFECDGCVIKLNNYSYYSLVGRTNRFPRWAIAYKFPSTTVYSQILSIIRKVTRNGRISFVANLNPVFLLGSWLKKVTLHNFLFIKEKKLNIGDEVIIKKSGDIIPQIIQVIKLQEGTWIPPNTCPSCGSFLFWKKDVFQYCLEKKCSEKIINNLVHFVSRFALNISGINYKMIKKLYFLNLLKNPEDFFSLTKENLFSVANLKEKTVNNLLTAINNSKNCSFSSFLFSLSINGLSQTKSQWIANCFQLDGFVRALENKEWEKIERIVGKKTAEEIKFFWSDEEKKNTIYSLKSIFNNFLK